MQEILEKISLQNAAILSALETISSQLGALDLIEHNTSEALERLQDGDPLSLTATTNDKLDEIAGALRWTDENSTASRFLEELSWTEENSLGERLLTALEAIQRAIEKSGRV